MGIAANSIANRGSMSQYGMVLEGTPCQPNDYQKSFATKGLCHHGSLITTSFSNSSKAILPEFAFVQWTAEGLELLRKGCRALRSLDYRDYLLILAVLGLGTSWGSSSWV